MRKNDFNPEERFCVKEEFSSALILTEIPPFGEQFDFTRRFKEALTFAYAEHFVEDSSISPKRTKFRLCEIILNGRVIGNTQILLKHYYLVII